MSQYLETLTNRFTFTEVGIVVGLILLTSLGLFLLTLQLTDDRKFSLISLASVILTSFISFILLVIVYLLPSIFLNNLYYFVLVVPLIINSANFITTTFEYSRLLKEKRFDIDFVSRFHFTSSMQTSAVLIITSLALIAFIPREISFIVSLSLLSIVPIMFLNHLLIRRFLK